MLLCSCSAILLLTLMDRRSLLCNNNHPFLFVPGLVSKPSRKMAKTRESRTSRPPLQPLPNDNDGRPRSLRGCAISPQPFQLTVRLAQALRGTELPIPAPRPSGLPAGAAALPPRRTAAAATLRGSLPFGQLLPDAAGQHIGGAATQTAHPGVHGVAAAVPRVLVGRKPAGSRQKEFEHRFVTT